MMKPRVRCRYGLRSARPHPQRPAFVVGRAEAVTIARDIDRTGRRGKNLPYLVGGRVHCVPGVVVVLGQIDRDEGTADLEFIGFATQGHAVAGLPGCISPTPRTFTTTLSSSASRNTSIVSTSGTF